MFAMPLAAQAASYTYIDQKAPYSNPSPSMLTALNQPKIGTTFKVQVPESGRSISWCWCMWAHCPPYCPYWDPYEYRFSYLAIGVRNPNVTIPALGGFLFTSAEVVMLTPWRNEILTWGSVTMSFAIPDSRELVGLKFYQQVLVQSYLPDWNPSYRRLSRGGVGVVGK